MELALHYVHLRAESPELRAQLCRDFYEQIYRIAFPKRDQAERPETWLALMGKTAPEGQPLVHIVLARDTTDAILGGIVFELYRRTNCWLATYIAVQPSARHHGVAAALLHEALSAIRACGNAEWVLFAEAENPVCITDAAEHAQAEQRIAVLDALGMKRLRVAYVQPALSPGKCALDDLMLLCYAPDNEPTRAQLPASRVAAFLKEFYTALGQSNSIHLQRMSADLSRQHILQAERLRSS